MDELAALVGFSFVSSVTPGPNNVLLWASGARFGFRRTVRHVVGTAVGLGTMALGAAAGIAALVSALPALELAMKVAGSAYLLFLAWQTAMAGTLDPGVVARPFGLFQAAAFQAINPKAWIFALGAVTTFRPDGFPVVAGSVLVAATMMVVIVPSASLWAAGGGALARFLEGERTRQLVSLGLAGVLALTVVTVWL